MAKYTEEYKEENYVDKGASGYYTDRGVYAVWHEMKEKNPDIATLNPDFRIIGVNITADTGKKLHAGNRALVPVTLDPITGDVGETFEDLLTNKKGSNSLQLFPVSLGSGHFSLLAVQHHADSTAAIYYLDSMGTGKEEVPKDILNTLQDVYPGMSLGRSQLIHPIQQTDNGCGIHACINARSLAKIAAQTEPPLMERNRTKLEEAIAKTQAEHKDIPALRRAHTMKDTGTFVRYEKAFQDTETDRRGSVEARRREKIQQTEDLIKNTLTSSAPIGSETDTKNRITIFLGKYDRQDDTQELREERKQQCINFLTNLHQKRYPSPEERDMDYLSSHLFSAIPLKNRKDFLTSLVNFLRGKDTEPNLDFLEDKPRTQKELLNVLLKDEDSCSKADILFQAYPSKHEKPEEPSADFGKKFDQLIEAGITLAQPEIYPGIGLDVDFKEKDGEWGFVVNSVMKGSKAEGIIKPGDFITHFGETTTNLQKITKESDCIALRATNKLGTIALTVNGEKHEIQKQLFNGKEQKLFTFKDELLKQQAAKVGLRIPTTEHGSSRGKNFAETYTSNKHVGRDGSGFYNKS